MITSSTCFQSVRETLHEGTIDTVIAHPLEMTQHGEAIVRAKNFCLFSIGEGKTSDITFCGGGLRHIRPEIDSDITWGEQLRSTASPMRPTEIGTVALRIKPPLVASHDFASKRAGIHALYAFSLIRNQRVSLHWRSRLLRKHRYDKQNIYYECSSEFFM